MTPNKSVNWFTNLNKSVQHMQQVVFILLVYFTLLNLCFSSYLFYCSPYYVIFAYLLFLPFQVFYCHLHSFLCCFSSAHIPIFVVSVIFFSHLYYHGLLAILIHTTHCFLGFMCVYCFYIFHFSIMYILFTLGLPLWYKP